VSTSVPAATEPTHDPLAPVVGAAPTDPRLSPWAEAWARFRANRLALVGLVMIVAQVLVAVFAPLVATHDPTLVDPANARALPSAEHWFGTDQVGRDLFSRVVHGARVSLRVGILSVTIAVVIGVTAGAAAGYYRGAVDGLVMRATDVLLAFPYILAAIAIISVVGPGESTVILVLGLLGWLPIARLLRAGVLQVASLEYVQAARALGAGDLRVIARHVLANAVQPVIVYATLLVGSAVLSEAALSYLGVGVQEPTPAWGLMVAQGRRFLATAPHLLFFPGLAIFATVTAFVFVGDGVRDALDPRG
jgi:peptide/nickel transport system permease protein